MKKINTYFLTGLLLLVPLFILYQVITVVSAVVKPFVDLPLIITFPIGIVAIVLLGWIMVHIFKNRLKKHLERASSKKGWVSIIATGILEFDNLSNKTHKAFRNPILYKVDHGLHKLGYITNEDTTFITTSDNSPKPDAVWVYAPYPVNFFGEMILVDKCNIQQLNKEEVKNLPLFILSAGLLQK